MTPAPPPLVLSRGSGSLVHTEDGHTLDFVAQAGEARILDDLARLLRTRRIAALFVEPVQGSNAAHEASRDFYRGAIDLCRETGTLSVFDETLTGLHRTGPTFYVELLDTLPDVLLYAKCLGNGFPVSSIAVKEPIVPTSRALPGSTFAGNPMALAAVEATLIAMGTLPMGANVAAIEKVVRAALAGVHEGGATLRGRGALWCLEFADKERLERVNVALREAGLLVTCTERFIRLLPAATMEPRRL